MRFLTRKREQGELELGIVYGIIVLAAVCAARFLPLERLVPSCLFHVLTGVSCPTCGATRSLVHFSHGDVSGALALNPLLVVALAVILGYFLYSTVSLLLKLPRVVLSLSPVEKNVARATACFLFLMNWTYLIVAL